MADYGLTAANAFLSGMEQGMSNSARNREMERDQYNRMYQFGLEGERMAETKRMDDAQLGQINAGIKNTETNTAKNQYLLDLQQGEEAGTLASQLYLAGNRDNNQLGSLVSKAIAPIYNHALGLKPGTQYATEITPEGGANIRYVGDDGKSQNIMQLNPDQFKYALGYLGNKDAYKKMGAAIQFAPTEDVKVMTDENDPWKVTNVKTTKTANVAGMPVTLSTENDEKSATLLNEKRREFDENQKRLNQHYQDIQASNDEKQLMVAKKNLENEFIKSAQLFSKNAQGLGADMAAQIADDFSGRIQKIDNGAELKEKVKQFNTQTMRQIINDVQTVMKSPEYKKAGKNAPKPEQLVQFELNRRFGE